MTMTRIIGTAALAIAIGAMAPAAKADDDDDRRKAAAIVGVIVGAAALAAASKNHRHEHHRYYGERRHVYHAPFSPRDNVTCYPRLRVCYRRNGRIAGRATQRYFGS